MFYLKFRRRSLDDLAFAEFDCNPNFVFAGSDPVKKISFYFYFLLCFIQKIRRRSFDDVAFAKFDCNPNFVLDDIFT